MLGNTGGFVIPTADMAPAGTFRGGINYIGQGLITPESDAQYKWKFDYDNAVYYVNFTVFDWLEASFRETLLKTYKHDRFRFREQDRSICLKVRPLKEGRLYPAVAIGINDPGSFTGQHPYASVWVAATKHLHSRLTAGTWCATVAYAQRIDDSQMYQGPMAGISYSPDFMPSASVMAEYDGHGVNVGVQALLWQHLGLYAFTRDFSKTISAGIRYQTTIKFRK